MAKKKIPGIVKQINSKVVPPVDYVNQKGVSHSQMTIYNQCPYRWKLQYKDRVKPFTDSMSAIFGKAIHEAIQKYLEVMYTVSRIKANSLDLNELFKETFKEEYKKSYKKNKNKHFSDPAEMADFAEDGIEILNSFKKSVPMYFSKRGWHFLGYELPINLAPLKDYPNVRYNGFLDLVFYDESSEKVKIIDIKTSKSGWGKDTKKDFNKRAQLILYKKYFSEQYGVPIENIEIEFFIVKRKLWEKSDFPQKRIQTFCPPDGKTSISKAEKMVEEFIKDIFTKDNQIIEKKYQKMPTPHNCRFCPFNNDPKMCDKSIF